MNLKHPHHTPSLLPPTHPCQLLPSLQVPFSISVCFVVRPSEFQLSPSVTIYMVVHLKHSIGCCWTNSWYLWLPNSQNLSVATSSCVGRAGPLEPLPHTQLISPVFCWPGVCLHWVQLHRVHDKNGLVIPRRWHPSSCLQLLPFSHSLVSESAYSWLSPRLPVIPSTVNSHVFCIHHFSLPREACPGLLSCSFRDAFAHNHTPEWRF